jgi:ABC-type lipoprotein export system ATPase subunit
MSIGTLFNRPGQDILVEGLAKTYRSGDQTYVALNGVSCRMPSGFVTVVQGPSGCGKSTFLNMLGGIDRPDSGSLRIGDRTLTDNMRDAALARYRLHDVGFVFQAFNLVPGLTAIDNLQLPLTVTGMPYAERITRGEALLDLVGMREKSRKRPDELSGGEQQRVATALALVNDPVLILADEPTGNLDSRNAMKVADLLCSLAHEFGKTVVISTHDPAIAARGDVVFHMRDGVMVDGDGAVAAAGSAQEQHR